MEKETREHLDEVACIAEANLNCLNSLDSEKFGLDDQGSYTLMSAYLELYDQITGTEQRSGQPSQLAFTAAEACCVMRRDIEQRPKSEWEDEEQGLFKLMLAFMYMFKQLYVLRA